MADILNLDKENKKNIENIALLIELDIAAQYNKNKVKAERKLNKSKKIINNKIDKYKKLITDKNSIEKKTVEISKEGLNRLKKETDIKPYSQSNSSRVNKSDIVHSLNLLENALDCALELNFELLINNYEELIVNLSDDFITIINILKKEKKLLEIEKEKKLNKFEKFIKEIKASLN